MSDAAFTYDFDRLKTGNRIAETNAVSVKGARNIHNRSANQDAFLIRIKSDVVYMAVADGLGSCAHSDIGARLAVACIDEFMVHNYKQYSEISDEMIAVFHRKLIDRWRKKVGEADYRQYDTTLLYAIVTDRYAWVGGIGDGMILCRSGQVTTEYSWEKTEFSNRTLSLASHGAAELMQANVIALDDSSMPLTVILATDGVAEDLEPGSKLRLAEYLHKSLINSDIIDVQHELEQWVLNWKTRHHSDDRTFCMMNLYKKRD